MGPTPPPHIQNNYRSMGPTLPPSPTHKIIIETWAPPRPSPLPHLQNHSGMWAPPSLPSPTFKIIIEIWPPPSRPAPHTEYVLKYGPLPPRHTYKTIIEIWAPPCCPSPTCKRIDFVCGAGGAHFFNNDFVCGAGGVRIGPIFQQLFCMRG
jgi:hypothetical protein